MLTQLVYSSRKNQLEPGEIFHIRDRARINNVRRDLTGVLLFNRDHFLQCLEGDPIEVTRAFTTIASDTRHREVVLRVVRDVEERSFPDWSMGLVDSTSPELRVMLRDLLPDYDFTPQHLPAQDVLTMMQRMRSLHHAY